MVLCARFALGWCGRLGRVVQWHAAQAEPVVGERDARVVDRGLGGRVDEFVAHVDEQGSAGVDPPGDRDGLPEREVGRVLAVAERVEGERAEALEHRPGLGRDGGDIGAVGQRPPRFGCRFAGGVVDGWRGWRCPGDGLDAIAENRHAPVEQAERREAHAPELDAKPGLDGMGDQRGDEGRLDAVRRIEDVLINAVEGGEGGALGVDIDGPAHDGVEAADLVEAEDVIDVVVGEEDGVEGAQAVAQRLLSEVRSGVDQNGAGLAPRVDPLHEGAGAGACVARVGRGACLALAGDARDARGGAGAEEGESHGGAYRRGARCLGGEQTPLVGSAVEVGERGAGLALAEEWAERFPALARADVDDEQVFLAPREVREHLGAVQLVGGEVGGGIEGGVPEEAAADLAPGVPGLEGLGLAAGHVRLDARQPVAPVADGEDETAARVGAVELAEEGGDGNVGGGIETRKGKVVTPGEHEGRVGIVDGSVAEQFERAVERIGAGLGQPDPENHAQLPVVLGRIGPWGRLLSDNSWFSDRWAVVARPAVLIDLPQGFAVSGVTLWAWRVVRCLVARGHRVGVLRHAEPSGQGALDLRWPEDALVIDARHLPPLEGAAGSLDPWMETYARAVAQLGGVAGPVVCLPQLLGDSASLCLAAGGGRARLILTNHSGIPYNDAIARHFEPVAGAFVAVSEALAARWRAVVPARARDVLTIENAVDAPDHAPARLGLAGRPIRVIYSGRLVHEPKRVLALPALSRSLLSAGVDHELTIVGDGPAWGELRSACAELPVRMFAPVGPEALGRLLGGHDVCVLPSRYEGLSLALLEALAWGAVPLVPAALTDARGPIVAGETALAAEVSVEASADAAGAALARALREGSEGLALLRRRGAAEARARSGLERFGAAWSAAVERAAASEARPWPAGRPLRFSAIGAGTVPADAADRARQVLERLAGRRVAVHGTGRHTASIATELDSVVCFIDDDPEKLGGECLGRPIVSPERAAALGVTDAIISSWINQGEIARRAPRYAALGVRLHRLYGDAA